MCKILCNGGGTTSEREKSRFQGCYCTAGAMLVIRGGDVAHTPAQPTWQTRAWVFLVVVARREVLLLLLPLLLQQKMIVPAAAHPSLYYQSKVVLMVIFALHAEPRKGSSSSREGGRKGMRRDLCLSSPCLATHTL